MRVLSAPEDNPAWKASSRDTVMGDAVHVMSPTGGVGAVAALHDAVQLLRTISEDGVTASSNKKFEDSMRDFARICIRISMLAASEMLDLPAVS